MQTTNAVTHANTVKRTPTGYTGRRITHLPDWRAPSAWDIWFNNLSIGVFLAAAVGSRLAPTKFAGLAELAYPLALALLIIDLLLLVSDLGDPARFHHMLRVFKLSSPMSLGTWMLSAYGVLLGLASVVAVLRWPLLSGAQAVLASAGLWGFVDGTGNAAAALAILPAIGGILYKGVLFSATAQPGWKDARWLGGYFTNSAILLGSAVLLLLALLAGQSAAVAPLRLALMALLAADFVLLGLLYRQVARVYNLRYSVNQRLALWIIILAGGIILPFLLLLQGALLIVLPPFLILPAALAARYALVLLPRQA